MKSIVISILIGLLAGAAAWQTLQLIDGQNRQDGAVQPYIDYDSLIAGEMRDIISRIPVNLKEIPVIGTKGDTLSFADVIPDSGARILRYSAIGCRPCEKKAFGSVYKFNEENGQSVPVIILVSQFLPRDLRVLSASHSNRFKFYCVDNFPFDYESESISPMIFDIDTAGHVSDFHIVTLEENQQ